MTNGGGRQLQQPSRVRYFVDIHGAWHRNTLRRRHHRHRRRRLRAQSTALCGRVARVADEAECYRTHARGATGYAFLMTSPPRDTNSSPSIKTFIFKQQRTEERRRIELELEPAVVAVAVEIVVDRRESLFNIISAVRVRTLKPTTGGSSSSPLLIVSKMRHFVAGLLSMLLTLHSSTGNGKMLEIFFTLR